MNFEWDENKNQINQRKHGISFEEAQAVFEATVKNIKRNKSSRY